MRTLVSAQLSQLSQRAARRPLEAVTEAGGVREPDQFRDRLGRHPRVGQFLDLLLPEPDQPRVRRERKPSVAKEFQPAARTPKLADQTFPPMPGCAQDVPRTRRETRCMPRAVPDLNPWDYLLLPGLLGTVTVTVCTSDWLPEASVACTSMK